MRNVLLTAVVLALSAALHAQTMNGVVDLHIHCGPDIVRRSVDGLEAARIARERGLRAIILKNHYEPTVTVACLARKLNPEIEVFGGIALNRAVGGVNPAAVERMTRVEGGRGKIVWMPTFDAENQVREAKENRPFVAVSTSGQLLAEVKEVLDLIAKNGLVFATGHSSAREVGLMIREARLRGVKSIIVTHPMVSPVNMSVDQMKEAAAQGAFLEFPANTVIGNGASLSAQQVADAIRTVGPEHCILTSDFGQAGNPLPPDGLAAFFESLRKAGLTAAQIEQMAKQNPARLLELP